MRRLVRGVFSVVPLHDEGEGDGENCGERQGEGKRGGDDGTGADLSTEVIMAREPVCTSGDGIPLQL